MVKTYGQLYLEARKSLLSCEDSQAAAFLARNLLAHVSGKTQEAVIADSQMYASQQICTEMEEAVRRILSGEPLAYVLGQWDFYGMNLYVDHHVLIPRDDTCAVTELALSVVSEADQPLRILDLCTGSGCIGLAIASRAKNSRVTLADLSDEALRIAKRNTSALKLNGRVSCIRVDAMEKSAEFLGDFHIIVSNPPYITLQQMQELPDSVKDFEPHMALYGGADGLDFYRAIIENFKEALKPDGYMCFEFGMGQGDDVCQILESNGLTILKRTKDYNNIERAVLAQYCRKER